MKIKADESFTAEVAFELRLILAWGSKIKNTIVEVVTKSDEQEPHSNP